MDSLGPAPGEPGHPCTSGTECDSGFCIQTPDGKLCTLQCQEECPFTWLCSLHKPSLPDEVFICAPSGAALCRPCTKNVDCMANGVDTGDICVVYGAAGGFCGNPCDVGAPCPEGYTCAPGTGRSGETGDFCVASEGECTCIDWYVDEAASTECYVQNEMGTCKGTRGCDSSGLQPCSAAVPEQEACDGVDNDCNGQVDDGCLWPSCRAMHDVQPQNPSGAYWIDTDGEGPLAAIHVYCDMETDGGGWTYGAILKVSTPSQGGTLLPGITNWSDAVSDKLANQYSVRLEGISFTSVRIDNFSAGQTVSQTAAAPLVWSAETYKSAHNYPAKRFQVNAQWEFRTGYYGHPACNYAAENVPICFVGAGFGASSVCDTDSAAVQGWLDATGCEICNWAWCYCSNVWVGSSCLSYASQDAVYGVAVR